MIACESRKTETRRDPYDVLRRAIRENAGVDSFSYETRGELTLENSQYLPQFSGSVALQGTVQNNGAVISASGALSMQTMWKSIPIAVRASGSVLSIGGDVLLHVDGVQLTSAAGLSGSNLPALSWLPGKNWSLIVDTDAQRVSRSRIAEGPTSASSDSAKRSGLDPLVSTTSLLQEAMIVSRELPDEGTAGQRIYHYAIAVKPELLIKHQAAAVESHSVDRAPLLTGEVWIADHLWQLQKVRWHGVNISTDYGLISFDGESIFFDYNRASTVVTLSKPEALVVHLDGHSTTLSTGALLLKPAPTSNTSDSVQW